MATWASNLSDVITNKWAELLGLLAGSGLTFWVLRILFELLIAKIKSKSNKPIAEQIAKNNAKLDEFETRIEEKFNNKLEEFHQLVKKEMQAQTRAYKREKAKAYNKIVKANEKAQKVVEDSQEEIKAVKEEIKAEIEPIIEVVTATEEVVETTEKVAEIEDKAVEQAKTTKLVAKKVITND